MSEQNHTSKKEKSNIQLNGTATINPPGHKPTHTVDRWVEHGQDKPFNKATPDNYQTGQKREGETLTRAHETPEFDLKK